MPWRVLAAALVAGVLAVASPAQAQTTALFFDSQPGDYIGGGIQRTLTPADVTFQASGGPNAIRISTSGASFHDYWFLEFGAPDGAPLQVGSYGGATRSPFTDFTAIDISGDGRGCNQETGRFVIREIVFTNGSLERVAVDFEQHCEDGAPGLFGALRYNSTVSTLVPFDGAYPSYRLRIAPPLHGRVTGGGLDCGSAGPVCDVTLASAATVSVTATPDQGFMFGGWTVPCHGSMTISVKVNMEKDCTALFLPLIAQQPRTLFLWNSQQGDYIGQGKREVYNPANSRWTATSSGGGHSISLQVTSVGDRSDDYWTLNFVAPVGETLRPGTYNGQTRASLDVYGSGRGCNMLSGSFTIYELTTAGGTVTSLALDFEQHCEGVVIPARPLRGSIRYNSAVPSTATLAVTTAGSGAQITLSPPQTVCVGRCMANYAVGETVQLLPTPSTGWTLSGWSGDDDCRDGVVTMNAPLACNATFTAVTVAAVSVTPNAGSGAAQTFALQYSDTAGATDLSTAWVWFNATFASTSTNTCLLYYNRPAATLFLLSDGEAWMSGSLGSAGTLQNSQCAVNLSASSASVSGNILTLNLAMTFRPAFAGVKNIYMFGQNGSGLGSGWQTLGSWTVPAPAVVTPVTADSVSPSFGAGAAQTFSLQYLDTAGATDLATVWVWFNATFASTSTNSCLLQYDRAAATLYLLNDGQTWMGRSLASGGTLQNSQCAVNLSASSVSVSGNILTLNLAMTFTPAYTGNKNIYMYAANGSGVNSGWQTRGTWTVPVPAMTVTADSVSPSSGAGSAQTFTLVYSDTAGATDLATVWVWFNATLASTPTNSCQLQYNRATNTLSLLHDGSTWLSGTIGAASALQNSQCAVALAGSSVAVNGNTLALTVTMTFRSAFAGSKNIYMYAANGSGVNSGWQTRGTWTVPAAAVVTPVTADSVSPSSGTGTSQMFALQYSDTAGATDLATAWVWFNATFASTSTNSCLLQYDRSIGTLFLLNDGQTWMAGALGSGVTLQNGQCAVNLAASSASVNGNILTLNLAMTFASAYAGNKNIYMYAASRSGVNSGWQTRGSWTVPATAVVTSVTADSVSPSSGMGAAQVFALQYTDTAGATDLATVSVWFNATFASTATNSCQLQYNRATSTLSLLLNDGSTWLPGAIGAGGTLQNSQCAVALAGSSVVVSGNTLTLTLAMTFRPAFAGGKSIYMYAASGSGVNSGWQTRGTWTVP